MLKYTQTWINMYRSVWICVDKHNYVHTGVNALKYTCSCSAPDPPSAFSGRALREYRLWTLKRGFVNLRVHTSHSQKTTLLRYVSSLEGSRHPQALMSKRADPETGGRAGWGAGGAARSSGASSASMSSWIARQGRWPPQGSNSSSSKLCVQLEMARERLRWLYWCLGT